MYSPASKKRDGSRTHAHTHTFALLLTHPHTDADMHTRTPHSHHITQMGHILGFTIESPHHDHNRMRAQSVGIDMS